MDILSHYIFIHYWTYYHHEHAHTNAQIFNAHPITHAHSFSGYSYTYAQLFTIYDGSVVNACPADSCNQPTIFTLITFPIESLTCVYSHRMPDEVLQDFEEAMNNEKNSTIRLLRSPRHFGGVTQMIISTKHCPRCGGPHTNIEARRLTTSTPPLWATHWLMCPIMEEPVLMNFIDAEDIKPYGEHIAKVVKR